MEPIEVCKYIARDLGVITKDDSTGVHGRFGKCYFTVTDKLWKVRKVRRQTVGTSPTIFIMKLHENNNVLLDTFAAAMLIKDITDHIAKKTI